jgi:hypothetical protein
MVSVGGIRDGGMAEIGPAGRSVGGARRWRVAVGAALAVALSGGGATAHGFVGLGRTQECVVRSLERSFAPFGDDATYFLVPGGDFDSPARWFGWSMRSAFPVLSDQPRVPGDDLAGYSLHLAPGASARSPGFCVRSEENLLRFFVKSQGTRPLDVVISTVARPSGESRTMRVGVPAADPGRWRLSPVIALPEWHASDGTVDITIRFEVGGVSLNGVQPDVSSWFIDDVFVDPFKPY